MADGVAGKLGVALRVYALACRPGKRAKIVEAWVRVAQEAMGSEGQIVRQQWRLLAQPVAQGEGKPTHDRAISGSGAAVTCATGQLEAQTAEKGELHCLRGQCGGWLHRYGCQPSTSVRASVGSQERARVWWQNWCE